MKKGSDPFPSSGAADAAGPYERLGVSPDAAFDVVQAAKAARLDEAGDDVMARSVIEAAYDAVLMDRLKERQQGRVSSSARRASQQENLTSQPGRAPMPSLPPLPMPRLGKTAMAAPTLSLAEGRERVFPLVADGLLLLFLLLVPTAPSELLLALVTGVTVLNLQRRNGRFLAAVGWSFGLLVVGLVIGGLLVAGIDPSVWRELPIGQLQVQSLPAWLLLLLGALLIG